MHTARAALRQRQKTDNIYVVNKAGIIEKIIQRRHGEHLDISSFKGAHIAESINDPLVSNYLIDQLRYVIVTGWPVDVMVAVYLTGKQVLRIATIEKLSSDRVLVFVHPAER